MAAGVKLADFLYRKAEEMKALGSGDEETKKLSEMSTSRAYCCGINRYAKKLLVQLGISQVGGQKPERGWATLRDALPMGAQQAQKGPNGARNPS